MKHELQSLPHEVASEPAFVLTAKPLAPPPAAAPAPQDEPVPPPAVPAKAPAAPAPSLAVDTPLLPMLVAGLPLLRAADVVVSESAATVDVVVTLSQASATTVTVNWSTGIGTAVDSGSGSDYTAASGQLVFLAGETSKTISILLTNDIQIEPLHSFRINFDSPAGAQLERTETLVTIVDNDATSGTPLVTVRDVVIDETAGTAQFVVMLDRPSSSSVSVDYQTVSGSATAGSDFTGVSGTLNFSAGQVARTVTVAITNDGTAELDELFTLQLSNAIGATIADAQGSGRIGPSDQPNASTPVLDVADVVVDEAAGYAELVLRLSAPSAQNVSAAWSTSIGTGVDSGSGIDFVSDFGVVSFAAGQTTKTVRIDLVNDTQLEALHSLRVNLSSPNGVALGRTEALVTIVDNDASAGTPGISVQDVVVDEAAGVATFVVTLDRPSSGAVSVGWSTVDGSAIAASGDYVAASGTLGFSAGEVSKTVTVAIGNDTAAEGHELFALQLSGATGANLVDARAFARIGASDASASTNPSIEVADVVVDEATGYAELVFSLSAPSAQQVSFDWSTSIGTAVDSGSGIDFVSDFGSVVFGPGETTKTLRIDLVNDTQLEALHSLRVNLSGASGASLGRTEALVTIVDNDATSGTPGISVSDAVVDEAAGTASFVVTLDRPSAGVVSVDYATAGGSAAAGSDFIAATGTLAFATGETSKTVTVVINNDGTAELDELFTLQLSNAIGATIADAQGSGRIGPSDQPNASTPVLDVADVVVDEAAGYAELVLRLSAPSAQNVSAAWSTSIGTGVDSGSGIDFVSDFGVVSFAAGQTTKTVRIDLVNDTQLEALHSLRVNLSSPNGVALGRTEALVTIVDNDASAGTPGISVQDVVVDEAAGVATFVVTLDRPSSGAVSVGWSTVDGSAIAASGDYVAASGTLGFSAGEVSKTVTVAIGNDTAAEGHELFALQLSGATGANLVDARAFARIGASDASASTNPSIEVADVVVDEATGYAELVFSLSAPSAQQVSFDWSTSIGTAVDSGSGIDFVSDFGSVVFGPGETTKTLRIDLVNDTQLEALHSLRVNLSGASGASLGRTEALVTIVDNDGASGTPGISVSDAVVDEAAGTASFVVTLDRPSAGVVSVDYATAGGSAAAGSDFIAATGTLAFATGETSKTVTVVINNDGTAELDELFTLQLSNAIGATIADAQGSGRIGPSDQPNASTPVLDVADVVVDEAAGYAELVLRLSAPSAQNVSAAWSTSIGTGVDSGSGIDFVSDFGVVSFAAGQTTKTVRIDLVNDTQLEALHSLRVNLSSPNGVALGRTEALVTIVDNDASAGTPGISVQDVVVDEAAGVATFVVTLDRPSSGAVSVGWSTVDGSAIAASGDYVAASGTLGFSAGEVSKTVTVAIGNDTAAEGHELFALQLSGATGANLVDARAFARIGASDASASTNPSIEVADVVVDEATGYAELVFSLSAPSAQQVSFDWSTSIGTAVDSGSGIDFVSDFGSVVFGPGETTKTLRIDLVNDTQLEALHSLRVNLSGASGASLGRTEALVTIVDNDGASGTPGISVSDAVVDESAGTASFVVTLDRPSAGVVSVDYATAGGSAAAGSDFIAATGTLAFATGETSKTVTVVINNDGTAESAESFSFQLSGATGGTLVDAIGRGVIGASDGTVSSTPSISLASARVAEGDGYVLLRFTLSAPSASETTVTWSTVPGTASDAGSGIDFIADSGVVRFAPGQTSQVVRIDLAADAIAEPEQSFSVNLSLPTGATLGNTSASVTIVDDDNGFEVLSHRLSDDTYTVDATTDIVVESPDGGTDTVLASVDHTLAAHVENLTLVSPAVNGTGNDLDNVLTGNALANTLTGLGANDTLDGGGGVDTLVGGTGNDTYIVDSTTDTITELAGGGTDTVRSSVGYTLGAELDNLVLTGTSAINGTGNALANTITGNTGNNVLNGGAGIDVLIGGLGNDTYVVDTTTDTVTELAGGGIDTVQSSVSYVLGSELENLLLTGAGAINGTGNALANTITGNAANNALNGGGGIDVLIGGAGNDTYTVDTTTDTITELAGGGVDRVNSSVSYTLGAELEQLVLTGTASINATGNALANSIAGNAGNNVINGGAGVDSMAGGAGNDTYVVDVSGDIVTELAGGGVDTVQSGLTWTLGAEIENLLLTGASAINGTGNALANTITGNAANNSISGGTGADTMIGGAGNDTYAVDDSADVVVELAGGGSDRVNSSVSYALDAEIETLVLTGTGSIFGVGNALGNAIAGNAGDNLIDGGAGNDSMAGGAGDDTYVVDVAGDIITELAAGGLDTVISALTWTLGAEIENLLLGGTAAINGTGNALDNTITGNAANNSISGGAGADTMAGGAGNDTYAVDDSADVVVELAGEGSDRVNSSVSYVLGAEIETLVLTGTASINGTGNALGNSIAGNAGNNVIDGGAGNDSMAGGTGNDTYVVDSAGDVVTEAAAGGTDTVRSSVTYALGAEVENLVLTGTGSINGTGNALANSITGNAGNNSINAGAGADTMAGGAGNDTYAVDNAGDVVIELAGGGTDRINTTISLTLAAEVETLVLSGAGTINGTGNALANTVVGNTANNVIDGGAGSDALTGGAGADTFVLASLVGSDTIADFASGVDFIRISQAGIVVGDGDTLVEGATTIAGPGGFARTAELVVVTGNIAGAITTASAAAAIGSASSAYTIGTRSLFAVDNGTSSALYLFTAADADAAVEAAELTLLATLSTAPSTGTGDYLFGA